VPSKRVIVVGRFEGDRLKHSLQHAACGEGAEAENLGEVEAGEGVDVLLHAAILCGIAQLCSF